MSLSWRKRLGGWRILGGYTSPTREVTRDAGSGKELKLNRMGGISEVIEYCKTKRNWSWICSRNMFRRYSPHLAQLTAINQV